MNEKIENTEKIKEKVGIRSSGSLKEHEEVVKVSGSATIEGGKMNKHVKSSGSCRIQGDLECNSFRALGSLASVGGITAHGDVRSSGSFSIAGNLLSDNNAKFSGSARIGGNAILQGSIRTSGSLKVDDGLEGGENAKFSGSAKIGKEAVIQGFLKTSGSFKAGDNVQAIQGLKTSGSVIVNGNILSQKTITIKGSSDVGGNVVAENINIGYSRWWKNLLNIIGKKHPYKVSGSVFAKNAVNIKKTLVNGNVKGRHVVIRRQSKVDGTVYYVDSIKIRRSAKLNGEPVKIKAEELSL